MGAARLVKDGINGLVVNAVDIDELAGAIARLASSSELRRRFGEQARNDARQYTYEQIGLERAVKLSALRRARHRDPSSEVHSKDQGDKSPRNFPRATTRSPSASI